MTALVRIPVGVVVERSKAASHWIDFTWQAVAVLPDAPEMPAWTVLRAEPGRTSFYAGAAEIALHPGDTANYRDNLSTGDPKLWVVLRRVAAEPPFSVLCVTADGSEAEAYTAAGDDVVEDVPMPATIREAVEIFVAGYHVEQSFYKRERKRADPNAMARRSRVDEDHE